MLATAAAARQLVARRAFSTTRARLSSPYHYPEGPLSNLPFNPRTKGFGVWYWTFMATGFGLPFGICGMSCCCCFLLLFLLRGLGGMWWGGG